MGPHLGHGPEDDVIVVDTSALVELGLILMVITLLVNILARFLVWRVARAPSLIRE